MPSPQTWCWWLNGTGCSCGTLTPVRYVDWKKPPATAPTTPSNKIIPPIETREIVLVLGWKICGIVAEPSSSLAGSSQDEQTGGRVPRRTPDGGIDFRHSEKREHAADHERHDHHRARAG